MMLELLAKSIGNFLKFTMTLNIFVIRKKALRAGAEDVAGVYHA